METRKFKRLPYGNSNFERLIMEDYAYVDKTHFIELLEQESNSYLFFTRPRKFGKSLFFTMLYHYYDICSADKFDTLFGDLYIGKHPTPKHNSYVVIEFDFSGLDTSNEEHFVKSFGSNIRESVRSFLRRHKSIFPDADSLLNEITVEQSGVTSLQKAYAAVQTAGLKLFVIIDEYDHFANDLIAMGTGKGDDLYRKMIRANGSVRDFYETLKAGSKTVIDRILLTGVTPIMLDDLTSGFNIANSLSLKKQYNEMLGFTQEEVNWLAEVTGVDRSLFKEEDLIFHYNGYLFHEEGKHRVYNPSMMLYFFDMLMSSSRGAVYTIDENLKTDYGRLRRLIMNEQNRVQLVEIAKNNRILSDIIPKFSIDELHDGQSFVSLLFYMGLLTIDCMEEGTLRLKIPNNSIRVVYWEYIQLLTKDRNEDILIDLSRQVVALRELAYRCNPAL
ncbi:MAG: AAA family ATPase, partial [Dysgonamonadaceae bacterium]|nr:AAA family ATPase [Dysgonamonadaceae bacterium]